MIRFVCILCKHEFIQADDYDGHVRMHETENEKESDSIKELNNVVINLILEHYSQEGEKVYSNESAKEQEDIKACYSCKRCNYTAHSYAQLTMHRQKCTNQQRWTFKIWGTNKLFVESATSNVNSI